MNESSLSSPSDSSSPPPAAARSAASCALARATRAFSACAAARASSPYTVAHSVSACEVSRRRAKARAVTTHKTSSHAHSCQLDACVAPRASCCAARARRVRCTGQCYGLQRAGRGRAHLCNSHLSPCLCARLLPLNTLRLVVYLLLALGLVEPIHNLVVARRDVVSLHLAVAASASRMPLLRRRQANAPRARCGTRRSPWPCRPSS